ncbi:MAG: hypothetical protein QOG03_1975 [Actinomycetota bacterium]|nr:hypothetical protein [Actinomycetota bacterium]
MSLSFADVGVPADVVTLLNKRGITAPFPIQAAALADGLAGRDLCGKAPTGSGKTLAFGIPLVLAVNQAVAKRPTGLVLVPTRELAAQVMKELQPIAALRKRTVACVYGGTGYEGQRRALRKGVDILVACPGRLEDLIERREVSLRDVGVVVIDEADRMADMGFLPAVKRLLDATQAERQTLLFSATLDGDVDVLIRKYQNNPSRHDVAPPEDDRSEVAHHFWEAERAERVQITTGLLQRHDRAIVFCRTKHGADRLVHQLSANGIEAVAIHGNRSQSQRERALAAFARGHVRALVATDVAARGIHVDDVPCVVHFDPPADHKDYVHRSGRTGRAGASGTVVSLIPHDMRRSIKTMQRQLGLPQELTAPDVTAAERRPVASHEARPARPTRYGKPGHVSTSPKASTSSKSSGYSKPGRPGSARSDRRGSAPGGPRRQPRR